MNLSKTIKTQFIPTALSLFLGTVPFVVQGADRTVFASTSNERDTAYQELKTFIQENGKSQDNNGPRLIDIINEADSQKENDDTLIDALSDHAGRFAQTLIRDELALHSEFSESDSVIVRGTTQDDEDCFLRLNPTDTNAGHTISISTKSEGSAYSAWAWPEWKWDNYYVQLSVSRLRPNSIRVESQGEVSERVLQWLFQKGTTESTNFLVTVPKSGSVRIEFKGFIGSDEWFSSRSKSFECEFSRSL